MININSSRLVIASMVFGVAGCASYPRFPDDSILSSERLMREFGLNNGHLVVGPQSLRGNTLRTEIQVFYTDRTIHKRYFGLNNRVFFQDLGVVAYGFIPLPVGDGTSEGEVGSYSFEQGVFTISSHQRAKTYEYILITRDLESRELACWISGLQSTFPGGWSKWDCTIEVGNTLKVRNR